MVAEHGFSGGMRTGIFKVLFERGKNLYLCTLQGSENASLYI